MINFNITCNRNENKIFIACDSNIDTNIYIYEYDNLIYETKSSFNENTLWYSTTPPLNILSEIKVKIKYGDYIKEEYFNFKNLPVIESYGQIIPEFVHSDFSSRFIFPFAIEVCKGTGYDIGAGKVEWALPGSIPIDPSIDKKYNDLTLPDREVDYIFSSHCLEHVDSWINTLRYWTTKLKPGGILFLYLPTYSKITWRPWINWSHKHILSPEIIKDFLIHEGLYKNIFVSETDLLYSFSIMCEKK